ncbi:MAG: hypothetical protein GC152_15805 [Alphaproteobacteria bacterium]|nr:hypothetical protein [Alphaproteobacteria bacterium]
MNATAAQTTLDVVADPICPWCYIGLNSLAQALSASPGHGFDVRLRPFLLYPDMPEGGVERAASYARKFPDPAQREALASAVANSAAEIGLEFDFALAPRIPRSLPALHLIARTRPDSGQFNLALAIYNAYWRLGAAIDAPDTLVEIAGAAGIDPAAAREALAEPMEGTEAEADLLRRGGVDGAPTFIVGGQAGFAGSMPPGRLLAALEHARTLVEGA